jgi:excisionase family DNA binding protein
MTDGRGQASGVRALWIADAEVAALLGVHRSTIWRWLDGGLIPAPRRVGGRTLWCRAEVELFARGGSMAEFARLRRRAVRGEWAAG